MGALAGGGRAGARAGGPPGAGLRECAGRYAASCGPGTGHHVRAGGTTHAGACLAAAMSAHEDRRNPKAHLARTGKEASGSKASARPPSRATRVKIRVKHQGAGVGALVRESPLVHAGFAGGNQAGVLVGVNQELAKPGL